MAFIKLIAKRLLLFIQLLLPSSLLLLGKLRASIITTRGIKRYG